MQRNDGDDPPEGALSEGSEGEANDRKPGIFGKTASSRRWAVFRGIVAVCGILITLLGCWAVAKGTGGVVDLGPPSDGEKAYASLQSNYGFFAGIYAAIGLAFIVAALSSRSAHAVLPWLCGLVFFGGAARLVSMALWGTPNPVFLLMIVFELAVPVAVSVWYVWIKKIEASADSYEVTDK